MSTRGTLYLYQAESWGGEVHLYTEMHDDLVHLYLHDGTNSELNFALPRSHAKLLLRCMKPEGEGPAILDN